MTHLRKLASSRSYRAEQGEFLCESPKLLAEALAWNAPVTTVVYTEETPLPASLSCRQVLVPRDVMQSVSPMESPQGVLFTCRMDDVPPLPETLMGRHYVVLDGVQDPGNVGTVLRTADAFDCDGLFLVNGCADLYNPKTVRATMGAVFRRPVWSCTAGELIAVLHKSGIPLYGAALRSDTKDARQISYEKAAVAIGSEGQGLSEEVLSFCDATIKIPMSQRCESLNAAAAATVLLWEMYR
ncbi:MAG: RNA methyltransferase [Clostridiales bacterium]|nr:RNA methyltransferase [Clostridiales bacterium]